MKFEDWFNQRENFSFRYERFYDDLYAYKFDGVNPEYIVRWLQAAYNEGYNHRKYELMDDGK
jgi:hypothetical protein